ncbi:unnamed protein product [Choristocarpus tenellus]
MEWYEIRNVSNVAFRKEVVLKRISLTYIPVKPSNSSPPIFLFVCTLPVPALSHTFNLNQEIPVHSFTCLCMISMLALVLRGKKLSTTRFIDLLSDLSHMYLILPSNSCLSIPPDQ